jgi:hypothetical protein
MICPVGGHNETLPIHGLLNNSQVASAAETEVGNVGDGNLLANAFSRSRLDFRPIEL